MKNKVVLFLSALVIAVAMVSCGHSDKKEQKAEKPKNNLPVDAQLKDRLAEFAAKPRPSGRFGLYVYDLTAEKEVFEQDADHAQPLASCMKLLSGVATLHRIGANYKYATSIYTRGTMVGDTLNGDITLRAGLDPQLQAEDLKTFTNQVRRKGIRHLKGHVIMDLALKEPVKAEEHWYPWDLSFSSYGILFKGPDKIQKALKQALAASGIQTKDDQYVQGHTPRGSHCRYRLFRTVSLVTQRMWKNSSNTQATSLLYTLGYEIMKDSLRTGKAYGMHITGTLGSADAYAAVGVQYLRHFLRYDLGQKDTALVVHDGCGLCTYNHLSPRAVAAILIYGYNDKAIYRQLMQNLSISGVDGTLRRLLADPRLNGKIHAKTGTLSHPFGISSLAGYCKGADGHDLCFALLDSEMSVLDAHVLQRNLCIALTTPKKETKKR